MTDTPFIINEEEGDLGEYPEPTSTDENISSTFETGPLNKKDNVIKRKKYYVKVINNDTATVRKKNDYQKQLKKVNAVHQQFLKNYSTQLKDRVHAAEKAFLSFKYNQTIPSAFKKSADLLQNYYTDS